MVYGNFIGLDKYNTTDTLDGGHFSGVPWVSALINGKGRYLEAKTGSHTQIGNLAVGVRIVVGTKFN